MKNEWRDVPGAELYQVNRQGEIKKGDQPILPTTNQGYVRFTVNMPGRKPKAMLGHRAVLLAFVGPPPNSKSVCCHLNGIRSDNRVSNLKWGTHRENASHKSGHGTLLAGEKHTQAKLTADDVLAIRREYIQEPNGRSNCKTLMQKYGVSKTSITDIISRRTWACV